MLGYILFLVAYFLFLPLTIFNALNVRKKVILKKPQLTLIDLEIGSLDFH